MTAEVRVVWRPTSALTTAELDAALAVLSDEEREQHRRFRFPDDARDYAAAHALVRAELSSWCGNNGPRDWRFNRDASGKPALAGGRGPLPSFSLTHTHGLVACAVGPANVAIGVDAERDDRDVDTRRLAARFFSRSEIAALSALDDRARRERFFDLWTLKEAVVKALGITLLPSLPSMTFHMVDRENGADIRFDGPLAAAGSPWTFALFRPEAGCRIAVAAAGTAPPAERPIPLTISCIRAFFTSM